MAMEDEHQLMAIQISPADANRTTPGNEQQVGLILSNGTTTTRNASRTEIGNARGSTTTGTYPEKTSALRL
ncbi:hypothetical protein ACFX13_013018 [Malus domestica]